MINQLENTSGIGGLQNFRIANVKHIDVFPTISNANQITNDIIFTSGNNWGNIAAQYQSISYSENSKQDIKGDYYEAELKLFVARPDYDRLQEVVALDFNNFVIDITDNNGFRRLIGNEKFSLKFQADLTIPQKISNISGFEITFSGILLKRAPLFNI